jgi:hypothetical protein
MKTADGRIRLGGVPDKELLVRGVAQDDFENMQGFTEPDSSMAHL